MTVSTATKPTREVDRLRRLAEPCVWTERMLTCLSQDGPKGGKWFSLIDKVWALPTLRKAWEQVRRNHGAAGVDQQSIAMFEVDADSHLRKLQRQLQTDSYRPESVKRVWIEKPGKKEKRPLGIPVVRDRIVQTALRMVIEPIFEHGFAPCSYGFRKGRGCHQALGRVEQALNDGCHFVVDADLKGYFDTIPHERLMACVETRIADGRILDLLRAYLEAEVLDGLERWSPETGTPQGAVISPLLANLYLDELDWRLTRADYRMVRYADDFVILCQSPAEAEQALALVSSFCDERELMLHPEKTHTVDATERGGFDFLGYHFERGMRWPTKSAMKRLRRKIKAKTKRNNGESLDTVIAEVNPILRGWFGYFRYGLGNVMRDVDGFVRRRIRDLLRKRRDKRWLKLSKRRRRQLLQTPALSPTHQWPNAYFHAEGLFCLEHAHEAFCQSLR